MSKPEIKLSGFWQDAFTKWRHWLCYMGKPGVAKKAKTEYSRAVRRKWKRLVRVEKHDSTA
jgi:hypothetical protein